MSGHRVDPHRQFVQLLQDLNAVVWEMDAQTWRFTFVSERAERIFGYTLQEWYDDPTFWQERLLHPEDRECCHAHSHAPDVAPQPKRKRKNCCAVCHLTRPCVPTRNDSSPT